MSRAFDGKIRAIAATDEQYISFTKYCDDSVIGINKEKNRMKEIFKFRFIDTYRFMSEPLSALAKLLPSSEKHMLRQQFAGVIPENLELLQRKGIFPYDYMDSEEKLIDPLPVREEFYNKLTEDGISEEDYEHAKKVFDAFHCWSMRDYAQLYLKLDVLILADVFEYFRKTMSALYGLDAAQYVTLASFSFDAMLKYTNAQIGLLDDDEKIE